MNYEEKYKEAIESINRVYNQADSYGKQLMWKEFPELRESEDERIRKALIQHIKDKVSVILGWRKEELIAWLEKQDNNEDSNILQRFSFYSYKDEPNILYLSGLYVNEEYRNKGIGTKILEVADEVAKSMNCHAIRLKTKKDSNAERLYRTHGYNSLATKERDEIWLEKQAEQESWSEEDKEIRQEIINYFRCQGKEEPTRKDIHNKWITWLEKQTPILQDTEVRDIWEYIKEWREKFGRLPKDEDELASCIDFISKRQKRVEWNDEDEKKRQLLIKVLEVNHPNAHFKVNPINTTNMEAMSSKELVDWLKSLKPHWKPNDLQLEALESAYKQLPNIQYFLQSLYNDLKQL